MGERGDQGFEVVPTRIGGSGGPARSGRRRRGPVIVVIAIAILVPAIAWVGPRIEWRPEVDLSFLRPTPTPVPSTTARPVFRNPTLATPLPAITVGTGPHPTEPFPVDVRGVRLADPTTGELGPSFGIHVDSDAVFASAAGDGWWCVCFARRSGTEQETVTVEIRRLDRAGSVTRQRTIGEYHSVAPPPFSDFSVRFDLEVSPDQGMAYLSSATRRGDQWTVVVEAIDLDKLTVVGRTELGSIVIPPVPSPTPSPDQGLVENYFTGPFTRLSPDGRRLLVYASVDRYSEAGPVESTSPKGWLIDLDEGVVGASVGRMTALTGPFIASLRTCGWMAWTTADELAAICWPRQESGSIVTLTLFEPDGTELREFDLFDATTSWLAEPVLDRANRRVFVWLPADHILRRLDLNSGEIDELKVDPAATGGGSSGSGGGGTDVGPTPDWASFSSDLRIYYAPQLLAEPDSGRLFALGVLSTERNNYSPASSGVWVFDSDKLTLLDRWPAVAAYWSIGLTSDARWVLAAGAPSADDEGNQTNWEASITVHDVSDGRPALQLGRLGLDAQVLQIPP